MPAISEVVMSLETDVRYLLDRLEIQDKLTLYALGQDYHQPGANDKNVRQEWDQIFLSDAQIDFRDVGAQIYDLQGYAELMRGPGLKGGGLEPPFKIWSHLEHPTKVELEGDTAKSVTPHESPHSDDPKSAFEQLMVTNELLELQDERA